MMELRKGVLWVQEARWKESILIDFDDCFKLFDHRMDGGRNGGGDPEGGVLKESSGGEERVR